MLVETYRSRLAGLPCAWTLDIVEIDDRKAPKHADRRAWDHGEISDRLDRMSRNGGSGLIIAMDEGGKDLPTVKFTEKLVSAEQNAGAVTFLIGGPDGLDPRTRARCDMALRLGSMTWPHKLARVMLAEQIYRAGSVHTGHPYHRAGTSSA